jgi:hypothetical protein
VRKVLLTVRFVVGTKRLPPNSVARWNRAASFSSAFRCKDKNIMTKPPYFRYGQNEVFFE